MRDVLDEATLEAADELIRSLLPEVRRAALSRFRAHRVRVEDKGSRGAFDPVTEADRAIEAIVRAAVLERFPGHRVVGEEGGSSGGDEGAPTWLVDPIDGTKAFVTGMLAWGTLVGLVDEGRPVAGWAYQPVLDELFRARPGVGWLDSPVGRRPLGSSGCLELSAASCYTTHPSMFSTEPEQRAFERIARVVRLQRFGGDCYSYCLLAIGQVDLVVESGLHPYDIVPLIPIVEAAGGAVLGLDGHPPTEGGFVIAAATPELAAQALALAEEAGAA